MQYRENLPRWRVLLNSQEIDAEKIISVGAISRSTGYPNPGQTRVGECTIKIADPTGEFSVNKNPNWFTQQSLDQSGLRCAVEIYVGSTKIFTGEISKVGLPFSDGSKSITCIDEQRKLTTDKITSFGIDRAFRLWRDSSNERVEVVEKTYVRKDNTTFIDREIVKIAGSDGVYPLYAGVTPLSEESITIEKASGVNVTLVDEIETSGIVDPNHVKVDDYQAVSEGGPIPVTDENNYPVLQGKSPFRWIEADDAVRKLINNAGITNSFIGLPPIHKDLHSDIIGRPGYENILGDIGQSKYLTWTGYVTDILLDGSRLYIAYSVNTDEEYFSRILSYDKADDSWNEVLTHTVGKRQIFNLAKSGNNLIFTATDARLTPGSGDTPPQPGSYDNAVQSSDRKGLIQFVDISQSNKVIRDLVPTTSSFPVQLGVFYQFGSQFEFGVNNPLQDIVADTRRNIIVRGTDLYYFYAIPKSNSIEAGIAKVNIAVNQTPQRVLYYNTNNLNHCGGVFWIEGSTLYFSTTFISNTPTNQSSTIKTVRVSL